ncbi:regulatory protein, luxR family [Rhodococcus triatomae]|uniref:Regulatory protein, luxR family n=1 Tax=Rhodococcus triatomae TaxID=300028 RepID=A0A1G8GKU8_9NOCA|nr:regulatory protein, luxR family [Rhodococcus triatomae]
MVERRPVGIQGYFNSRRITHEYDAPVRREGIETLLAVPVVVRGRTRGTLYGGLRENLPLGDRATETVATSAAALAREIEIRDEVDRRTAMLKAAVDPPPAAGGRDDVEDPRLRAGIAENCVVLGELVGRLEDPELEARFRQVEDALRRLVSGESSASPIALSRRERDVLNYVALGCRNAEIGERLSLSTQTVKTYMRNLMAKLDVRSRHEAVVEARRHGLIP